MRIVWLVIVVLVVAYSLFVDFISTANSAIQASQIANQTTARMLILIALTLAFWFADARPQAVRPEPRHDTFTGPAEAGLRDQALEARSPESKVCASCGKYIAQTASICRHCGAAQ